MASVTVGGAALGAASGRLLRFVEKAIREAVMFRSTLNNIKNKLESLKPLVDEISNMNDELDLPKEIEDLALKMSQGVDLVMECLDVKKWEVFKRTSCAKKLRAWEKSLEGTMELLKLQGVRDMKKIQGWDGRNNKGSAAPGDLMMMNGLCSVPDPPSLIVGLDDSLKNLKVELLVKDSSVLVLTGPGGSGKTTLATMFCQDYEVKEKFKIFFVKFAKKPSLELIVHRLFQHNGYKAPFIQDKEEALNMLIMFLKNEGKDHPILLVLDDVWSGKEPGSFLLTLLPTGQEYKILVTSRSKLLDFPSYQLEPLHDEDAMTLFKHYASLENGPNTRDDLVKEMVERCKRFPLALQVTGGALRGQSREIWQSKLEEWSTGSSILNNETELLDRLKSSLDFLDVDNNIIKECFLDLGAFPEDVRIPAAALIDIWTELHGIKQDDQAMANLQELTTRTLTNLVVTRRDTDEGDCYYSEHFVTQHNLLRDLAIHQSNEDPERKRLLMEFNGDMLQNGWKGQNGQPLNTRLLSISTDGLFSSDWSKLKDLTLPKPEVLVLNLETQNYALPEFGESADELKVLIITNFGFFHADITNFQLLISFPNLKRIRLERIAIYSLIEKLEKAQLGNLQKISLLMCKFDQAFSDLGIKISNMFPNLVEINIDYCDDLVELPAGLCDIVSLKKLSITHCHTLSKLPGEIGNLVNLEALRLRSCIDLTELPDTICKLSNLTFLDISDCFGLRKLPEDIGKLCSLKTLKARSCSRFSELPSSIVDLEQLKEVICDEELKEQWDSCFPDSTGTTLSFSHERKTMVEGIGEMHIEEAVGSLISVIVKAKQKTAMFKDELKKLQGTLESLNPVIKQIIESNKELDRTDLETKNLESLLEKGKKLVQDCLKVKSWNLLTKYSYANKLIDLDNSFLRSLTLLQCQAIEIGLDINKTVRRIDANIQRIGLGYVQSELTDYCSTPEVPPFTDGLDEPLNDLRRWVLGDDTSVLVLTAPGGCGKTTLAMKLCSDEKIQEKFKKNIFFVDVPKEPSLKLIVQALCKHSGYQEKHFQDDNLVVNMLKRWKDEIGQYPLLLILDDVWPKWEPFIDNFAFQKPHCKVLVTSRSEFPSFGPSYRLEKLQEKEATTLLRHYSSLEDQENSRIPEDLVNQVVKHCKGYPLALEVIGKSLCGKSQEVWLRKLKKWSNGSSILIENELLACLKSSLDAMDEETEGEKGLLKECFLDLGLFPEGQWIPLTALIDMWKELYEIDHAAAYLSDLSNENMANLVVSRKDANEQDGYCSDLFVTQHDLHIELAIHENLLKIRKDANEQDGYYSEHFVTQHGMLKELAIHENRQGPVEQRKRLILDSSVNSQNEWKDLNEQPINAKLLSISTDGLFPENWSNKQLPAEVLVLNFQTAKYALPVFVGAMNKLKVLIITNYGFFPVEVDDFQLLGSLSSLRRMRLERIAISSLTKIPAQKNLKKISLFTCKFDQAFSSLAFKISDIFPNLEEINIDYCDDLVELPPGLCEIVSLKTLSITHCHKLSKLPEEIEKLVNLQVLRLRSCIDMAELPDSICKLDKLTFLDISDCFSIRKLPEDIGKLCSLRTLNMRSCSRLPELPPSVVELEHLKEVIM